MNSNHSASVKGKYRIAFLGLGNMGAPMAERLADTGIEVSAWTRSSVYPEPLASKISVHDSAQDAAKGCNIVVAMLASPSALDSVVLAEEMQATLSRGGLLIDMGTSGPDCARHHALAAKRAGYRFVDAPVSGGVRGAESGSLTIFVGGENTDFDQAKPVLEALGTPHHMGSIGAGQTAKLANQIVVAVNIAGLAEAIVYAEKAGLDCEALLGAMQGGFADSTVLRQHGPRMVAREFSADGAMSLHLKDINLAADSDRDLLARLGHAKLARQTFEKLVEMGHGLEDHSGYIMAYGNRLT